MQIKFSVDGDVQMSRNLRVLVEQLADLGDFLVETLDIVEKRTDALFAARGANAQKNPVWAALSPATMTARQKGWGYYGKNKARNPSTLRWTGNLQESREREVKKDSARLEFTAPYAQYHQRGGPHLPKRAIIDIDNGTAAEITRAGQRKIDRDLGISGLQTL